MKKIVMEKNYCYTCNKMTNGAWICYDCTETKHKQTTLEKKELEHCNTCNEQTEGKTYCYKCGVEK